VAHTADGASRWSLDHLFLDHEGVPTLVEVKRATDTRARREVVAQMLDYAANATAYWKVESLQAWFEAECDRRGEQTLARLEQAFGVSDEEEYWNSVRTNLAAERIRLVFVADEIASELRAIVEYLNRRMTETTVIAIEVKQYVDASGERQTIVPRVLGQTEAARRAKGGSSTAGRWDRDSLLAQIRDRRGEAEAGVAAKIFDWAEGRGDLVSFFGRGRQDGSFTAGFPDPDRLFPFILYGYGRINIQFEFLRRRAPFTQDGLREGLRTRLNAIPDVQIPPGEIETRPAIPLAALLHDDALQELLDALDWAFAQASRAKTPAP